MRAAADSYTSNDGFSPLHTFLLLSSTDLAFSPTSFLLSDIPPSCLAPRHIFKRTSNTILPLVLGNSLGAAFSDGCFSFLFCLLLLNIFREDCFRSYMRTPNTRGRWGVGYTHNGTRTAMGGDRSWYLGPKDGGRVHIHVFLRRMWGKVAGVHRKPK
ncbi:hypothetical protein BD289DRAFT_293528 [Coniella lustricola]|uniref:Uncharacterized protein n=1 Tax=Coniella lustricola TaxID=2025994 RepID=A0A2T3A4Y5_9PEZI|nr:hypothetical protein BD289DRAFT_293528 [Coniella lustricola]